MPGKDLVIVGASAAGLAAAIAAARGGAEVTVLEAKPQVGVPPSPAIVGLDSLWPEQIERPAHTARRRLAGAKMRATDGRGFYLDAPLTIFDRTRFDAYLAEEARKAGARILTGVQGLEVRPDRTLAAPGLEMNPGVLLFADGARSQATRFLKTTRDPSAMQWGAALELTAPEPPSDGRLYVTLGPHAPGGRSQLTPLGGDRWLHWTFFRGDPGNAEALARRALALDARLMGDAWRDVEARFTGVGPDPLHTLPGELAGHGVMAAGAAAGQGGLESGLSSGWIAGEVAALALRGNADVTEYERRWRKRFKGVFERNRRTNDMMIRLTDVELREIMGLWDGRHLGGRGTLLTLLANPRGALALVRAGRATRHRPAPTVETHPPPQESNATARRG